MAKKTTPQKAKKGIRKTKQDYDEIRRRAEALYLDTDLSQKEIAHLLDITEVTLSNWANDEKNEMPWDELRKFKSVGRPQTLRKLYERLIQQIDDKQNSDSIHKTLLVIKELEDKRIILPDMINFMKEFSLHILQADQALAKALIPHQTSFIKKKANERR